MGLVKREVVHTTFHFLFDEFDDSVTISKIKQIIPLLKENQLMQQKQIKGECELLK